MKRITLFIILGFISLLVHSGTGEEKQRPNVILIMADDMGYECLGANVSMSYKTPNLDALASEGIRFSKCISQPLCTPSRVKIMTGMYNYRNMVFNDLIEFSGFFKTFADIVDCRKPSDGKSFYPLFSGQKYKPRKTAFVNDDPHWGNNSKKRNQFVMTTDYKLYQDG